MGFLGAYHSSNDNETINWNSISAGATVEKMDNYPCNTSIDDANTELKNTNISYPISHVLHRSIMKTNPHPKNIILFTCDLYGLLPPVALLTYKQAAYYYLSGYSSLSTDEHLNNSYQKIIPLFNSCFGSSFLPLLPTCYTNLFLERIEASNCSVYLVNTGWFGGARNQGGQQYNSTTIQTIINAILNNKLANASFDIIEHFNLMVPTYIENISSKLLTPRNLWASKKDYDNLAKLLVNSFQNNRTMMMANRDIQQAGPQFNQEKHNVYT